MAHRSERNLQCLIMNTVVFLLISTITLAAGGRPMALTSTDSILEIINTQEVERLIAERRQNSSQNDKRFLAQNDLDEDFPEPENAEIVYQPSEMSIDFESGRRQRNHRVGIDVLMRQYNDSSPYHGPDVAADLSGYRGHKLLKSSKNALLVTKKEYLKKDWCKTEPLVQRIREEGCLTRTVINRFCYGQCNSFYIPKNPRRRRSKHRTVEEADDEDVAGAAFRSCSFCKPKKFTWVTVTLRCPSMTPQFRKKRIQKIKQCKCIAENLN